MKKTNVTIQSNFVCRGVVFLVLIGLLLSPLSDTADAGLVSHWKLDGDANDSAGTNHGSPQGDPVWTTGVIDGAINLDGDGDYILGSTSPFNFEDTTFSVAAWFKKPTVSSQKLIVSEGGYIGGWSLNFANSGEVRITLKTNTTADALQTDTINNYSDNVWHHVAAIVTTSTSDASGNSADIYIDGALVSVSEVKSDKYSSSSDSWRIGARPTDPLYFNGRIDDVRIYNHALSQSEITALVPEPATLLLLGFGILMLRGKSR